PPFLEKIQSETEIVQLQHRAVSAMMRILLLCITLFAGSSVAQAAPLRVGFLCPSPAEHPFWKQVIHTMRAAANDLQIELIVKCDEHRTTYTTKKIGTELLNAEP